MALRSRPPMELPSGLSSEAEFESLLLLAQTLERERQRQLDKAASRGPLHEDKNPPERIPSGRTGDRNVSRKPKSKRTPPFHRVSTPRVSETARPSSWRVGWLCLFVTLLCSPIYSSAQSNVITTVAGQGVAGTNLGLPTGVAVDSAGNLYIADAGACVVWKVTAGVGTVLAGTPGNCSALAYPIDVATCGGNIYFATHGFDTTANPPFPPPPPPGFTPITPGALYMVDSGGNLT